MPFSPNIWEHEIVSYICHMKILMVCLGNICRSPMADGLLRHKVRKEGLDVDVDSAGTSSFHVGEAPDKRMQEIASRRGTPIDNLKAREFKKEDLEAFDLIYAMDRNNYRTIVQEAKNEEQRKKVKLILDELDTIDVDEVPDPYYGSMEDFSHVYDLLDCATDKIIEKIKHA